MPAARYANACVQKTDIMLGSPNAAQFGVLLSEYDAHEYWDLRATSSGGAPIRAYVVSLRQRITMYSANADSFGTLTAVKSYSSYPILLAQKVIPSTSAQGLDYYLDDYSPKTLNTAVATSQNQATSSSAASTVSHTSGSSTSTTNAYDVSESVGFFGEDMTGSVTAGFSHSKTHTTEQSSSTGDSHEQGSQAGRASSMSIKDWGSYAFVDAGMQQPSWVWGQEYPWNVIDYRNTPDASTAQVDLPGYVMARLCDGTTVFPPSHLAQFGLNFTAHARWIFYVDGAPGATDETVTFNHQISYWQGSHAKGPDATTTATASLAVLAGDVGVDSVTLNLPVLALNPITAPGAGNGAIVGFVKSEFICPPASGSSFRLKSGANNVYVTGTGFDVLSGEESVLTASAVSTSAPASLTVQFKVIDEDLELTLYLKHWNISGACTVTLAINEPNPATPLNPIVRHVDAQEAGSGSDNVTAITLRKKDYTSVEFYDYLAMGLNTVVITVTPSDGAATSGYALRALALG